MLKSRLIGCLVSFKRTIKEGIKFVAGKEMFDTLRKASFINSSSSHGKNHRIKNSLKTIYYNEINYQLKEEAI